VRVVPAPEMSGTEPSPESFQYGSFAFLRGGLTLQKLTKSHLIYSVSCFNLGGLGAFFGGDKPPKAPCGDGTGATFFRL